ncbi:MAG: hypothetical protein WKG07_44990 [Hymenobacter sp.]
MQFTGDVTIALRNLRGGGKQMGLQWRKVDAALAAAGRSATCTPISSARHSKWARTFNLYKQNRQTSSPCGRGCR